MKLALLALACMAPLWAQKAHELCAACHSSYVEDIQSHAHFAKGVSCDTCHGKSEKHIKATGAAPPDRVAAPDEVPALCGACHVEQQKDYQQSEHGKLVMARSRTRSANCGTCHGVHAPRKPAQIVVQCRRCHEQLPAACSAPPPAQTAKVSCMNCHAKHTLVWKK